MGVQRVGVGDESFRERDSVATEIGLVFLLQWAVMVESPERGKLDLQGGSARPVHLGWK